MEGPRMTVNSEANDCRATLAQTTARFNQEDSTEPFLAEGPQDIMTQETYPLDPQSARLTNNGLPGKSGVLKSKGLSLWSATIFIIGEMAGAGVLALPYAMAGTGWSGAALIVLCCLASGYAGIILGDCWLIMEERWEEYRSRCRYPYPAIGERAVGRWMRYVVSGTVNLTLFGASVVVLLLCAQLVASVLSDVFSMSYCFWVLILGVILLPMTWLGTPKDFWPAAIGAMVTTGVACILLVVNILLDSASHRGRVEYPPPTLTSYSLSFGTILFAFGGAFAFPTFQNDMRDKHKFSIAAGIAFVTLLVLYIPVAVTGYAIYGNQVNPNVLLTVQPGPLRIAMQLLIAGHLFFAFVLVLNPLLQEVEEFFQVPSRFGWKRCTLRSIIMIAIIFIGETIPSFDKILNLIGGSTITLSTLVFPPWFFINLCRQKNIDWPERHLNWPRWTALIAIMILGVIGATVSTFYAIRDITDPKAFALPCYINISAHGG